MNPDDVRPVRRALPTVAPRGGLPALLVALAAWGGWLIWRTSFLLDGRRVFCLFDDAMISMTYARNLVEGYGLNWARHGAPVEGFTHPLWMALMVPVNLLPIALDRRSLPIQLAGLGLLMLNVVLVRRLVLRHFTRPGARHWLPAAVLTAFYYPLAFWSLIGMETGLQAVLTSAAVLLALDVVDRPDRGRDRHLVRWLVATAAVLLRPDMLLLVVAVEAWVIAGGGLRQGERPERRGPGRHAGWWLGVLVLVMAVAGYGAFRGLYFHDVLPNTWYLKMAGIPLAVRLLRGGSVLLDSLREHGLLLLAVGVGVLPQIFWRHPASGASEPGAPASAAGTVAVAGAGPGAPAPAAGAVAAAGAGPGADGEPEAAAADDRGWGRRLALPALVFVLYCGYSLYIGGDAWEDDVRANRFVAFVMPMVFVLFNALLNQALSAWRARRVAAVAGVTPAARYSLPVAGGPAAGAAGVEPGDGDERSSGEEIGDGEGGGDALGLRTALVGATVAALLVANGLWLGEDAADNWKTFTGLTRPTHVEKYEEILRNLRTLQQMADPGAVVAVTWAGITAYFSDFKMADQLGYNDRYIARSAPAMQLDEDHFEQFVPGHAKWDLAHVLEQQRPDAVLQVWGGRPAVLVLRSHGYRRIGDLWVDPTSPHLHRPPVTLGAAGPSGGGEPDEDEPDAETGTP
jgi:hypothetical protein